MVIDWFYDVKVGLWVDVLVCFVDVMYGEVWVIVSDVWFDCVFGVVELFCVLVNLNIIVIEDVLCEFFVVCEVKYGI